MKKINLVSNIVINNKNQILLIRKQSSNKIYPISGKLEINEKWIKGAKREIFEETTLKAQNIKYLTKAKQIFQNDKKISTKWFLTTNFTGSINSNYREGYIYWEDIQNLNNVDMLIGDKKIIFDYLNQKLKKNYTFKYDKKRNLK